APQPRLAFLLCFRGGARRYWLWFRCGAVGSGLVGPQADDADFLDAVLVGVPLEVSNGFLIEQALFESAADQVCHLVVRDLAAEAGFCPLARLGGLAAGPPA